MAKKSNEIKEDEELKEKIATEATENEEVTSTGETAEELVGEKIEASAQDEKVEENAEMQDAQEVEKLPTVKEIFKDKYDEKVVYNPGDVFIESEEIEDKKPVKVEKGKYKVSKERYEELKRSLYVD